MAHQPTQQHRKPANVSIHGVVNGSGRTVDRLNGEGTQNPKSKAQPITADAGLIVMDMTLQTIVFDRGAASILNRTDAKDAKQDKDFCIPKEIMDVIRSRKPAEVCSVKTRCRIGKSEYLCRVHIVEPQDGLLMQPIVVLHLERDSANDALNDLASSSKLTAREVEALKGIIKGLTSKEMGRRMNISPNTVRAFLRLIMIKMGVTTRGEVFAKIYAKILESSAIPDPEDARTRDAPNGQKVVGQSSSGAGRNLSPQP
jgi:DNA-binding CsgD family transcriptional regulator